MIHYDSSRDRVFNCVIVYRTPAGRAIQVNQTTIAPTPEEAMALAEKIMLADKRRLIGHIEFRKAIPL